MNKCTVKKVPQLHVRHEIVTPTAIYVQSVQLYKRGRSDQCTWLYVLPPYFVKRKSVLWQSNVNGAGIFFWCLLYYACILITISCFPNLSCTYYDNILYSLTDSTKVPFLPLENILAGCCQNQSWFASMEWKPTGCVSETKEYE